MQTGCHKKDTRIILRFVGTFKDDPTIGDRYLVNTEKCVGKTDISIY
jgi:hypothetical protein